METRSNTSFVRGFSMSNLIEQFNFDHLCRVIQHKNGKQYCHTKGILYSDLYNKFKELSQEKSEKKTKGFSL